ncbi:PilT protein domain protein [Candidatus Promineifilum breve]|uniref:PilT protein domain protein n=1 Tax=Candidatus Promineifilum breve TaxID=1806508 RepID=A0A170PGS4_9CHLR|nr:PIN domain-containing protein [Candidatus Promineifilum breve]CUS03917.2 PilT protein domain protein [Candidatus Promineifilum breve]
MNVTEMEGFFFLDTNILIYAHDKTEPEKQEIAIQLVRNALLTGRGIISTQVVQEFLHAARRKFRQPMSFEECHKHLQDVLQPLCAYFPSISTYDRALLIVEETGFHFYDALIVAAAVESGCGVLLTEDLQHGRKIGNLTILNPFAE